MFGLFFHTGTLWTVLVCFVMYKLLASFLAKKLRATLTALDDLPFLGLPRKGRKIRGTAVICGGSLGGLFSARVCSDHFENVVIVEPEEWLATPEGYIDRHRERTSDGLPAQKRSRVPQYTANHTFQPFAVFALRKWFPKYDLEVKKTNGRFATIDNALHLSGCHISTPLGKYLPGSLPPIVLQTRPLFETTIRRLLMATCSNVKQVCGTATGLVRQGSQNANEVSVCMRSSTGEESTLPATLVIDCTGPALGGLRWLQALLPEPKNGEPSLESLMQTYNAKMAYTTCEFDVPTRIVDQLHDLGFPLDFNFAGVVYVSFPNAKQDTRNFVVKRCEINFMEVVCGGWDNWGASSEITSIAGIREYLSQMTMTHPIGDWVYKMLDLFETEAVPVIYKHSRSPSVYIEYSRAQGLPSNFIALGDSVLQLNPIRGQGGTKACVEAVSLNGLLTRSKTSPGKARDLLPADFGKTFFSVQAARTGALWETYKSEDYAWKTTIPVKGDNLATYGAGRRAFGGLINQLIVTDPEVAAVWWHVASWLAPPTDLLTPEILLKLAWLRTKIALSF
ncbi:hypothetical protein K439DRAFT_1396445 [Ramaria rubella]|nr:hypothetical protein K439DRAFT_1396445 [Ramaria rubella]